MKVEPEIRRSIDIIREAETPLSCIRYGREPLEYLYTLPDEAKALSVFPRTLKAVTLRLDQFSQTLPPPAVPWQLANIRWQLAVARYQLEHPGRFTSQQTLNTLQQEIDRLTFRESRLQGCLASDNPRVLRELRLLNQAHQTALNLHYPTR